MNLHKEHYENIVEECGGSRPFDLTKSNYFVVYSHRTEKFQYFTVNDGYEAPERFYMTKEVAEKVVDKLNSEL